MSFRTRLRGFFIGIVIVPMIMIGFLVFRLIGQSSQSQAEARTAGLALVAATRYDAAMASAQAAAKALVGQVDVTSALNRATRPALRKRLSAIAMAAGVQRVLISSGGATLLSVGTHTAIAPGSATVATPANGSAPPVLTASTLTAAQYAAEIGSPSIRIVIRNGGRTLASTLPTTPTDALPNRGNVTVTGVKYSAVTQTFRGFGDAVIHVTVLSSLSATAGLAGSDRTYAAAFIVAFLLIAIVFSFSTSFELQRQIQRLLAAARRLGSGDFSHPVETRGHDEFAELGHEFNNMSEQLRQKLDELREAVRRTGRTFAANLDRQALPQLALDTAIDGAQARSGRFSTRESPRAALVERARQGPLTGVDPECVLEAERAALRTLTLGEHDCDEWHVLSAALGLTEPRGLTHGLITVVRETPFSDDDRQALLALAAQTTLAFENVLLHEQVQQQAVTDELTGLANHRRFQELMDAEIDQVHRYHHPLGLIMLDIDNFKRINDTYGHPQGDIVLRHVARAVQDNSRDVDLPARYGGEEMAVILPHTPLDGAYAIAERVRTAIEGLRIPRLDRQGVLRVTASVGVAAAADGSKDALIAEADGALYQAKHQGKNRTVGAEPIRANVASGQ
jgi:diguanylate cyclase (GGDEF)-like protein